MKQCAGCGKEVESHFNFCNWECNVDLAKREGGRVHCPNGLPIRCIRHDGLMLECEHGDHPDYKFPVVVEYVGDDAEEHFAVTDAGDSRVDMGPDWVESQKTDVHALIYTDGNVALTMYECCYVLWSLRDGRFLSGPQWLGKDWRLNALSITQINELVRRTNLSSTLPPYR
jgi:hypothetical protein